MNNNALDINDVLLTMQTLAGYKAEKVLSEDEYNKAVAFLVKQINTDGVKSILTK